MAEHFFDLPVLPEGVNIFFSRFGFRGNESKEVLVAVDEFECFVGRDKYSDKKTVSQKSTKTM